MAFDILINNGMVIDGAGAVPREVDVGITGDHITTIGNLPDAEAGQIIDRATFEDPYQLATGKPNVLVSDKPVELDAVHTQSRPERVLRRGS